MPYATELILDYFLAELLSKDRSVSWKHEKKKNFMTPEHIMQTRFPTRKILFLLNRLKNDNRGCFLWVSSGEGDDILRG
jgi:hypothetical protein